MNNKSYDLFLKFIETYKPQGFVGINLKEGLIIEIEKMLTQNDQSFYMADMMQLKVLYASNGNRDLTGMTSGDLNPYHFMSLTHPEDLNRRSLGISQLIKMSNELYKAQKGTYLLSTTLRHTNSVGNYSNYLVQCYLFYSSIPYKTVFLTNIRTQIDWCKKIKYGYHFYVGDDMSYFRFPDIELLNQGNVFTEREFEIIKYIATGLDSKDIAGKLFISQNTVNTHRRNILKKTHKANISELILELKDQGVL